MNKVLFCTWHGLGDAVMMTPALRKYKKLNPDIYIGIATLKRFGNTIVDLLSNLDFIDEVIPCLPDAWNDFKSYKEGVNAVIEKTKEVGVEKKFNSVCILPTNRLDGFKLHKIFRFAEEMNISFDNLEELDTTLNTTEVAERAVDEFLKDIVPPYLVLHTVAGNGPKTLSEQDSNGVISWFKGYSVLEFGRCSTNKSILVPETDMEFTKALVKKVDKVVAIDSVIMHIAGAFSKDISPIFTMTPVHQAIPITPDIPEIIGIDNDVTQLQKWEDYRLQILNAYPATKFEDVKLFDSLKKSYQAIPFYGYPSTSKRSNLDKRWKAMSRFVSGKVLDIGCNIGYYSFLANKAGCTVLGIDSDQECINIANKVSEIENCKNIEFKAVEDNLLEVLKKFKSNEFDYVLYLSVHHHMYTQFGSGVADTILNEISRISKNMIFDMGQCDEEKNEWMLWADKIPKFRDPKLSLMKQVIDTTSFVSGDVISSTNIHNTNRWLYQFNKKKVPTVLIFDGKSYKIIDRLCRTVGSSGKLYKCKDLKPNTETRSKFYIVERYGKKFFVKEVGYNIDLRISPEEAAMAEFCRGQKLLDLRYSSSILAAISVNKNRLLFEYYEGKKLSETQDKIHKDCHLDHTAIAIQKCIGDFDLNLNNILVAEDGGVRFIDFELAECNFEDRLKILRERC